MLMPYKEKQKLLVMKALILLLFFISLAIFLDISFADEIIIDNTPPVVLIIRPTTASPNYTDASQSVGITFNFTENNPSNYTIEISNYTAVVCSKINTSLTGGANKQVNDTCAMAAASTEGNYNLTVNLTDIMGNTSSNTQLDSVIIDLTPATLSNPQPANNSDVNSPLTFGISTNEIAECRYATLSSISFGSMTSFANTNATAHSSVLTLQDSGSFVYFIKCRDKAGNTNPAGYMLVFQYLANYTYYGSSVGMNLAFHIGTSKDDDSIAGSPNYIATSGSNVVVGLASSGHGFAANFSRNYSSSDMLITLKESADDNMFLLGFTKGDQSTIKNKLDYLGDKKVISKTFGDFSAQTPAGYPIFIRLDYDDADIDSRIAWSGSGKLLIRNHGNTDRGIPNITIELIE